MLVDFDSIYLHSGKSVCSIENFIQREILPSYGNTHTSSSYVGKQESFTVATIMAANVE